MASQNKDYYSFDLKFDGELVENSANAYDVANTIIAISTTLQQIVRIKYGEEAAKKVSLNINAFKEGSLKTQFLMLLTDPEMRQQVFEMLQAGSLTVAGLGKETLSILADYIAVRKWLKGKKPKKVTPSPQGDSYTIYAFDNATVTINKDSFKALQDRTVAKNMSKAVEPLEKEGSQLENLSIEADLPEPIVVNKSDAKYIKYGSEEIQKIAEMHLKGVITKIDTKVRSGYLDLGATGKRRVSFTYQNNIPLDQFDIMVRSLRTGVQIYLIGVVDMDMEGQPRAIDVDSTEEDEKLL